MRTTTWKWLASTGMMLLLGACGGGGSGGGGKHDVYADYYCLDQSTPEQCQGGGISPRYGKRVSSGSATTFTVEPIPGYVTGIRTFCGMTTRLEGAQEIRRVDEFGDVEIGYRGDLRGVSFTTAAVTRDCEVFAVYSRAHEVTTDPGEHGTISPRTARAGAFSQVEFRLEADDGYLVGGVTGCGDAGRLDGNVYLLSGVTADCQLSVSYLEIPDMAGLWSGTWEGIDSAFGPVTGTWFLRLSQDSVRLQGPIRFSGDLDCAEGRVSGVADPRDESIGGKVERDPSPDPCPSADWTFEAFDDDSTSASGKWYKSGLSNGAFEGRRIALPDGPEIHGFYPPWAGAGAWVTIVGEKLDMDLVNDSLTLGSGSELLVPESATPDTIRLRLPMTPGSSQAFHLTTYEGSALSPLPLNTSIETPDTGYQQTVYLDESAARPASIVFSINNRRVFVADRGTGSVRMINTDFGEEFTSTRVTAEWLVQVNLHALAAAPDGRRIYAAGDNLVAILHAHTLELLDSLELPAYGSALGNPQGIAISPDGRWLLLSEAAPGGRVTVVDIEDDLRVANTLTMPAGSTPRGLAVHPNGRYAYIAVSGSVNNIQVYDLFAGVLEAPIEIGDDPVAVGLTPDGERLLIVNAAGASLVSYLFDSGTAETHAFNPGSEPRALAVTPDGSKVFVTSNGAFIRIVDLLSGNQVSVHTYAASSSIAISRDGRRAYVGSVAQNWLVEIGNQRTLRISKQGGGVGTVRSSPNAIVCGTQCSATFDAGTQVTLHASQPPNGFRFKGWYGDGDCSDGVVTMSSNRYCIARFEVIPPPAPPPGGSGGGSVPGPNGGAPTCFIATAAYGSWLDPKVMTLRVFRDRYLLTNEPGRRFVDFYYRHSPPIADYIRERETLRATVRAGLGALVFVIERPLVTTAGLWLLLILVFRRSSRAGNKSRIGDCDGQAVGAGGME